MKVYDVVKSTIELLGINERFNNEITEEYVGTNQELKLIVKCVNLIEKEIACDYISLFFTERVECNENKIYYTQFSKTMIDVSKFKTVIGENASYFTYPQYIFARDGEYEVTYTYIPETKKLLNELDYSEKQISKEIISYGTAAEFCLISGLYDDALKWERKFKDGLEKITKNKPKTFLQRQHWI